MVKSQFIISFLDSFFRIFKACVVEVEIQRTKIVGKIMYTDGDTQEFVWHYLNLNSIEKHSRLLNILFVKKWMLGDKIIISEQDLFKYLESIGWSNNDINEVIHFISSFKINMIDDGDETDSFFIHF